jgi:dipeptidyl aminopeptidase/acylaminoacyl peptidase
MMDWRDRFRAGNVLTASRAEADPSRGVVVADHEGAAQAYAWDVAAGNLRRVSQTGAPVFEAAIEPAGRSIVYHHDPTGSEFGHLHRVPFDGGAAIDLTPDLDEYVAYLTSERGGVVASLAALSDGLYLLCVRDAIAALWPQEAAVSSLRISDDGSWIALGEAMDGMYGRTVVRSLHDGSEIGRLDMSMPGAAHGAQVAIAQHDGGWLRPAIWQPGSQPRPLNLDLPGDVAPADWSADGARLLLFQVYRSRGSLFSYELDTGLATRLATPPGTADLWTQPQLRAGAATALWGDPHTAWSVIEADALESRLLLRVSTRAFYPGPEWREVTFPVEASPNVQAWLLTPEGIGPWPAILYAHGGPTSVAVPNLNPVCLAWVDSGYALLSVNYRGSTTFGDDYREALTGNVGSVDVADMVAGQRWLVEAGIARPDLVIANGLSYGGYLTLQLLGTHPDLFAGGIAGAPIADWILSREDQNAALVAYARALFGAEREPEVDVLRQASPRTYVDRYAAPLLISTPEADSRTPLRPIQAFVEELQRAGKEVRLDLLRGGHQGTGAEADIAMMERWIEFAAHIVADRLAGL